MATDRPLTTLQHEVLSLIQAGIAAGAAPTRREIAHACGIRHPSQVDRVLMALEARCLIRRDGTARGITLVKPL